jgi:hypothetical protein
MAKFHLLSRARRAALVARGNQEGEPYSTTEATQANITFLAVGSWRPSLKLRVLTAHYGDLTRPFLIYCVRLTAEGLVEENINISPSSTFPPCSSHSYPDDIALLADSAQ